MVGLQFYHLQLVMWVSCYLSITSIYNHRKPIYSDTPNTSRFGLLFYYTLFGNSDRPTCFWLEQLVFLETSPASIWFWASLLFLFFSSFLYFMASSLILSWLDDRPGPPSIYSTCELFSLYTWTPFIFHKTKIIYNKSQYNIKIRLTMQI